MDLEPKTCCKLALVGSLVFLPICGRACYGGFIGALKLLAEEIRVELSQARLGIITKAGFLIKEDQINASNTN